MKEDWPGSMEVSTKQLIDSLPASETVSCDQETLERSASQYLEYLEERPRDRRRARDWKVPSFSEWFRSFISFDAWWKASATHGQADNANK